MLIYVNICIFARNEDLLLFLLSYFFCRVDSWCKLVFNCGKPTVNMFYDDVLDLYFPPIMCPSTPSAVNLLLSSKQNECFRYA